MFLQSSTIGLVTLNEMKAKQEDVMKERKKELARKIREQKLLKKEIEANQAKKKEQRDKVCCFEHFVTNVSIRG